MTSRLKLLTLVPIAYAGFVACTAGGEVIPENGADAGGSSSSAGTGTVIPSGGSSTGTSGSSSAAGTGVGGSATTGGSSTSAGTGTVMGGTGTTGGEAGTSGSATGGSGGGTPMEDPYEAVKVFDNWRVDMECKTDPGKTFLSPDCTQGGDICWMADDAGGKTAFSIKKKVGGDPNTLYKFRVRVRGVLEPKAFDPAKCPPLFMGPNVPMRVCKCVDPACIPNESGFNWMQLNISAPKQRYYMNNAKDSVSHRVEIIDGQFDIEVQGQADVEYFFDNLNTGEIRNCSAKLAPELPFVDGNFFIFNILPGSVTATPQ